VDPDLEDAADVGMGDPAGNRDLLVKARQERFVTREIAEKARLFNVTPLRKAAG